MHAVLVIRGSFFSYLYRFETPLIVNFELAMGPFGNLPKFDSSSTVYGDMKKWQHGRLHRRLPRSAMARGTPAASPTQPARRKKKHAYTSSWTLSTARAPEGYTPSLPCRGSTGAAVDEGAAVGARGRCGWPWGVHPCDTSTPTAPRLVLVTLSRVHSRRESGSNLQSRVQSCIWEPCV